jgi:hypothetical protein
LGRNGVVFQNGILFGQHHSAISKIIDDFSAEDSSVVLSIESFQLRNVDAFALLSLQHGLYTFSVGE